MAETAKARHAYLLAGSLLERAGEKVYNTSVLFDRSGAVAATYRKIHLFEARLEDGTRIREAEAYDPGREPVAADIEGWQAGLAICYDLRFPELFRTYAAQGAHLLFVPSNFTQRTGKDHWEVLVRARAIENQCFVVAPNQCGVNPATGVRSHGHSMIVGPWGEVLAAAADEESVILAKLDPADLAATRNRVPALRHRVL
jgi:nitrilase